MALNKINTVLMLWIAHKVVNYILCNHRWPCELTHFTNKIGKLPMILIFIEADLVEWTSAAYLAGWVYVGAVWLVWNQLYGDLQYLFLFAKQTNPIKQEVNSTVILPPLVFPGGGYQRSTHALCLWQLANTSFNSDLRFNWRFFVNTTRPKCYKTFCVHDLLMFLIS
jgi:hypothetical protein